MNRPKKKTITFDPAVRWFSPTQISHAFYASRNEPPFIRDFYVEIVADRFVIVRIFTEDRTQYEMHLYMTAHPYPQWWLSQIIVTRHPIEREF